MHAGIKGCMHAAARASCSAHSLLPHQAIASQKRCVLICMHTCRHVAAARLEVSPAAQAQLGSSPPARTEWWPVVATHDPPPPCRSGAHLLEAVVAQASERDDAAHHPVGGLPHRGAEFAGVRVHACLHADARASLAAATVAGWRRSPRAAETAAQRQQRRHGELQVGARHPGGGAHSGNRTCGRWQGAAASETTSAPFVHRSLW